MRPARLLPLVLLAVLAAPLAGCVEAEETWTLDGRGGGTYALVLRWNADLWRRVTDVLGAPVMARLEGRPFPVRAAQWRDGLERLPGVEIVALEERATGTGLREVRLEVRFERLADLLRWEVLARRTARVTVEDEAEGRPGRCLVYMEPIARVPVLDRLAALLDAEESPPLPAPADVAARDPPALERLGVERAAAELVWRMVKGPLESARLATTFHVPGDLETVGGRAPASPGRSASFAWDFAALRRPATDRTVRFAWRMRTLDEAPRVEQVGDRDPRPREPDGRRR